MPTGSHIILDIIGISGERKWLSEKVFGLLKYACNYGKVNIVHEKVVFLPKQQDSSPPGFTGIIVMLLDESHVTAHSYSETGLLAVDCFTCGELNLSTLVIDIFVDELKKEFPKMKVTQRKHIDRFIS
jgi:S-adenosylmethionine decarboxylase